MTHRLLCLAAIGVFLGAWPELCRGQDSPATWPQWRGPTRDGQVAGPAWPKHLKNLKMIWRVELGPSYSGPIVASDRVFVTETHDKTTEIVRALERKTGKELWRSQWPGAVTVPGYARGNGEWIRSTPAWDGASLFVAGMRDVLVCLDADSGKERWRVDFVERYKTPLPLFGFVCSPLVDGDGVYVQAAASLIKLDKKTGKVHWRLEDKERSGIPPVSSPVLATLAGARQLVVQHPRQLAGVDPATGAVLWDQEIPAFRNTNVITPIVYQDSVLTSAFGGRTHLVQIARKDGKFTATTRWDHSAQGYLSSPVVVGAHVYMHLRSNRVICLDLKTGKELWLTDETFGRYWSMVAQGDRVLALDQTGVLRLMRANPKQFEIIEEHKISEQETWAHLAICDGELFIRDLRGLSVYRWEP